MNKNETGCWLLQSRPLSQVRFRGWITTKTYPPVLIGIRLSNRRLALELHLSKTGTGGCDFMRALFQVMRNTLIYSIYSMLPSDTPLSVSFFLVSLSPSPNSAGHRHNVVGVEWAAASKSPGGRGEANQGETRNTR